MTGYTASTTNATNTVTATPADPAATVTILLDGADLPNGTAANWEEGDNTLEIAVVNGNQQETYTVTVTKS